MLQYSTYVRNRSSVRTLLAVGTLLGTMNVVLAQAPLHERIDQLIAAPGTQFAAVASDAEFLRRVCLDLTGTIPTTDVARTFLQDSSATKRAQFVERLLTSPEHARHLANVFDRMLMERRNGKHVPAAQWQEYLRAAATANKPWDELVREILSADGADPKLRPAAKFYLDRDAEPNLITRDISRLFLGMNLQCAQCHDHPVVDSYKQDHFQGIYAFLNRTFLFTDKSKVAVLAEKAEGEVSFQSVFDPTKTTKTTAPRMPGRPIVEEPKFEKGKEYNVLPAKDVRPVPKFSRRAQLAAQITDKDNRQFQRASANRFWAMLMGRGLVHPVEFDHPANPPSHPELLNFLADELAASGYDVRAFLRELVLSKTYQRSSEPPATAKEARPETFAVALLKPLSPEQFALSLMQGSGLADAERKALGKSVNESALYARLAGGVATFVSTFGSQPGQPESFDVTLDQTLFLSNGNLVRTWLTPRAGNLIDRLLPIQDPAVLADELYLSVLTRLPLDEEKREIADFLKSQPNRPAALQELGWALLMSVEFRFNH